MIWFREIESQNIDLLKIDIEDSEYVILSDPRFDHLNIRVCEWQWFKEKWIVCWPHSLREYLHDGVPLWLDYSMGCQLLALMDH